MNDTHRDLFARDGHLTMLSLDRYDTGELDPHARRGLELHVEGCARCRERLGAVTTPAISILPRVADGRSTGSATIAVLVGSAAAALAASTMLGLGAAMWPSPQPAWHEPIESALVEGSYTSVAQEEIEIAGLDLDLDFVAARTNGRDSVIATTRGEGLLAVSVLRGDEVVAVLSPPTLVPSATPIVVPVPRRWSGERIVAVLCPSAFTLEPGDTLAPDPGCVVLAAR
jgi:hypothetical protein